MFSSATVFFSVYVPLVILAVLAIAFEEKLIAFEQKIKRAFLKKSKRKSSGSKNVSRSASQNKNAKRERGVRRAA